MTNTPDISLPRPVDTAGHGTERKGQPARRDTPVLASTAVAAPASGVAVEPADTPDISLPRWDDTGGHDTAPDARPSWRDAPVLAPLAVTSPASGVESAPPSPPDPPAVFVEPDPPAPSPEPASEREPEVSSRRTLLVARQIRRLVVLAVTIVLLGTGAGLLATMVLPATYAARAEILYSVGQNDPAGWREDRDLMTQLVALQGRAVLGPVAQGQDRAVEDDLADDVTVTILEASEVIRVEARGPSPDAAVATAQAIVDRYFALTNPEGPDGGREYLAEQFAAVQSEIADARGRLVQLQAEAAAGIGDPASVTSADSELQALLSRRQDIQFRLDELNTASTSGSNAELFTPTYAVPDPVSPRPLVAGGTGALIGLIVAAGAVVLAVRGWTVS